MSLVQLWESHTGLLHSSYVANLYCDGVLQENYKDVKSAHSAAIKCLYNNRHNKGKFVVGQSSAVFDGWLITTWTCDVPPVQ
jgi:hypothetical protein